MSASKGVWHLKLLAVLAVGFLVPGASFAIGSSDLPAKASLGSPVGAPWIRVAVVRDQPQVDLAIHGRFRILALHTTDALREGTRLPQVAVRASQEGIVVGEQTFPLFGVRVEPARDATIRLNGQRLRGTLEIVRQANLTLLVVNHVDVEDYLRGVLSKEAPHYWPMEALRALAIAARTYSIAQRFSKAAEDYDVTGDVMSQVYGGRTAERRRTTRAVEDTAGLILTVDGEPFPSFYHSTCGGLTEHASVMGSYDVKPLRGGVACSFCEESPFFRWERRLTKADVAWALTQRGYGSVGGVEALEIIQWTSTSRVAQVRIRGRSRSVTMSGYDVRAMFGFDRLRSTAFSIEPQGDSFVLRGRGWGHGVGLCQWGAAELAKRGLRAHEILAFYYPKADLRRLGDSIVQPARREGG